MIVQTEKQFIKEVASLPKDYRNKIVAVIKTLQEASNRSELTNIEKLQGFYNYYKIRVGYLRIGLKIIDETITLITCQKRGDIYKHFP